MVRFVKIVLFPLVLILSLASCDKKNELWVVPLNTESSVSFPFRLEWGGKSIMAKGISVQVFDSKTGERIKAPPGKLSGMVFHNGNWIVPGRTIKSYDGNTLALNWELGPELSTDSRFHELATDQSRFWALADSLLFAFDTEGNALDSLVIPGQKQMFLRASLASQGDYLFLKTAKEVFQIQKNGLEIGWRIPSSGIPLSWAVGKTQVFLSSGLHGLRVYEMDSGQLSWETGPMVSTTIPSPPVPAGQLVIFLHQDLIYCFESKNGAILWTAEVPEHKNTRGKLHQLFDEGIYYYGWNNFHKIYRIDTKDGSSLPPIELQGPLNSNFLIREGRLSYCTADELITVSLSLSTPN